MRADFDETAPPVKFVNDVPYEGPYIDKNASKNVTAVVGETALINCRVPNSDEFVVSKRKINLDKLKIYDTRLL